MRRRLIVVAATVLATGALACSADVGLGGAVAGSTPKCPRGQVPVTQQGKTTCRPSRSVLPPRRKGDQRLFAMQAALAAPWPDGKNPKQPPTVEELLGATAYGHFEDGIEQSLARLDRLAKSRKPFTAVRSYIRTDSLPCNSKEPVPTSSDSYTQDNGKGEKLDARISVGAGGATIGLGFEGTKGGQTISVQVTFQSCDFDAPSCPTSEGVLDGTEKLSATIKAVLREGDDVRYQDKTKVKIETKIRGQVADDAKLDYIDIDNTETQVKSSSGSARWLSGATAGVVKRHTRVDMRTGAYDPGQSDVDVKQSFYGPLSILVNEAVAKANAIKAFQDASNKSFAAVVDKAIKEYRRRETAWQEPNTCAELTFSPASGSLKLDTGDAGRLTSEVQASRGGRASGRWRLVARKNLTITPPSAEGTEPAFQYRVTRGGSKIAVSATFRATSKAGVAKGTWEQNGNDRPQAWVGTITGTSNHTCCSENVQTTWTAPIRFKLTHVSNPDIPGIEDAWHYDAISGRVNWNTMGKSGPCTVRGSGSTPIVKVGAPNYDKLVIGSLDLHQLGSRYWYTTVVTGVPSESSPVQQSGCEGGGLIKRSFYKFTLLLVPPERSMRRDDQSLSGSSTYKSGGGTETYTWQLKAVK